MALTLARSVQTFLDSSGGPDLVLSSVARAASGNLLVIAVWLDSAAPAYVSASGGASSWQSDVALGTGGGQVLLLSGLSAGATPQNITISFDDNWYTDAGAVVLEFAGNVGSNWRADVASGYVADGTTHSSGLASPATAASAAVAALTCSDAPNLKSSPWVTDQSSASPYVAHRILSGLGDVEYDYTSAASMESGTVLAIYSGTSDEIPTGTSGGLVVGSATSFVGEGFVGAIEAASGSYTLVAAQGSYALSGQAAGLRASRILTAAQGSYALTGQAAALRKSYPLIAAQGSYSLNGQSANLVVTRVLAAAQGSYALTGQAANLVYGKTLTAAQGAYSLTGQDAALRVTRTMVAGQGSYNLSGQAANLFAARQVTAEQGAYSLTGMAAGLLYSGASPTLIAGMGSYSLTGQDVALRRTAILLAAQGDYTITGQVAGLRADRVLSAATGFYTLTGEPADLLVTIPPAVTLPPAGGDDVPDRGHRGWDRKRSRLKLHREREFTEQIRDLYRELTGDPRTAARAEAILAPIVAAVPAAGESEAAREAALEARAEALRARADALEADAMQAEIALRLLHRELRDWQEDDDLEAIQLLLSQVL